MVNSGHNSQKKYCREDSDMCVSVVSVCGGGDENNEGANSKKEREHKTKNNLF